MTSDTNVTRILSAGAPKAGVTRCAEIQTRISGDLFHLTFATAPEISKRLRAGTTEADIIVAPSSLLRDISNRDAVVLNSCVDLGTIATGVAVRSGATAPDFSSVETFRDALLAADRLAYNRASSGLHIEKMMDRLGITQTVADRIVRFDSGREVMEYIAQDNSDNTIAFGQSTEIRRHVSLGLLRFVGPLPTALEKKTLYSAALATDASGTESARRLMAFFATGECGRALVDAGLERDD